MDWLQRIRSCDGWGECGHLLEGLPSKRRVNGSGRSNPATSIEGGMWNMHIIIDARLSPLAVPPLDWPTSYSRNRKVRLPQTCPSQHECLRYYSSFVFRACFNNGGSSLVRRRSLGGDPTDQCKDTQLGYMYCLLQPLKRLAIVQH
jgi:hypothetical protein